MMKKPLKISLLLFIFSTLFAQKSFAETLFLPDSRDQQYRTYGLFIDEQSILIFKNAGKAWGAIGGTLGLMEWSDLKYKPQLVVHGSANASFGINSRGDTLLTETIDARAGLSLDLEFTDAFRGAIIWTHQSGHISDNVPDVDLIGSNLGNEILTLRVIRDLNQTWRLGLGLRPSMGSDPGLNFFGAEQFIEWFPNQFSNDSHSLAPFMAMGAEEYGRSKIDFSFHFQAGFAAGNHFLPKKIPSMRVVVGYYNGVDTRLKYFQFKGKRSEFGYLGLMFEL